MVRRQPCAGNRRVVRQELLRRFCLIKCAQLSLRAGLKRSGPACRRPGSSGVMARALQGLAGGEELLCRILIAVQCCRACRRSKQAAWLAPAGRSRQKCAAIGLRSLAATLLSARHHCWAQASSCRAAPATAAERAVAGGRLQAAMASQVPPRHPTKPPAGGPGKFSSIPTEWRLELPEAGATPDAEFGGCRSIEAGYHRGHVLGQGTYGEVRRRSPPAACTAWKIEALLQFALQPRLSTVCCCCHDSSATTCCRSVCNPPSRPPTCPCPAAGVPGDRPAVARQGGCQEDQDGQ